MSSPSSVGGSPQLPSFPSTAPLQSKDAGPSELQLPAPLQGSPAKPDGSKKSARDQELVVRAKHAEMVRSFFALSTQDVPKTEKIPYSTVHHDYVLHDPYHWQRQYPLPEREEELNPEIKNLLDAENWHYKKSMAPCQTLVDKLYEEMKGRITDDDKEVPVKNGPYTQWWEYAPGSQRKRWLRQLDATGEVQVLLDEEAEAIGKDNYRMITFTISPDREKIVVVSDNDGSENLTCVVRDIESGKELDKFPHIGRSTLVWTSDSSGLFYMLPNGQRPPQKMYLRALGETGAGKLLYEETQGEECLVGIVESSDKSCVFVVTSDYLSNEVRVIRKNDPTYTPVLIHARKENVKVSMDAAHGKLWMRTNEGFELFEISLDNDQPRKCRIEGSDEFYLTKVETHHDFLLLTTRDKNGLDQLLLMNYETGQMRPINIEEATGDEAYSVRFGDNPDFHSNSLRIEFSSMRTPATTYDYDIKTGKLSTLKVQQVPSGYNPADYETKRLLIRSRDGEDIPVSICYHRTKFKRNGTGKICVTAYGAYGSVMPPTFATERICLMDREYADIIIHPRGGDDKGTKWKTGGSGENRENTFNDVIDVLKKLIALNYSKVGNIALVGKSAGGTMVGAVLNEAPEILGAAIADTPFVDVLNTLLDKELLLTPGEWPIFGNPIESKKNFETIFAYSPYDQIREQDYPPILMRGGLLDPRVTYWEPLKSVSKLRDKKMNDNPVILHIDTAGHLGKAGRYEMLRETAENYAFVLVANGNGRPCRHGTWKKNMPQKTEETKEITSA